MTDERVRLQKALSAAGVASRRLSEIYISTGRVSVNGETVTELGTRIDPSTDRVSVDGRPVQLDVGKKYVVLNKPTGVVSSLNDEQGRPDLREFTREYEERLYNVGRLDQETSGLLVLTNDGELAHALAHPSFGVSKVYIAKVSGRVTRLELGRLLTGIELEDGVIRADRARILQESGPTTLVEIELHSGKNRIVRRMLAAIGHPVLELVRRSFGPLQLGSLAAGDHRELTRDEVSALLTVTRGETEARAARGAPLTKKGKGGKVSDPNRGKRRKPAAEARALSADSRGERGAGRAREVGEPARGRRGAHPGDDRGAKAEHDERDDRRKGDA